MKALVGGCIAASVFLWVVSARSAEDGDLLLPTLDGSAPRKAAPARPIRAPRVRPAAPAATAPANGAEPAAGTQAAGTAEPQDEAADAEELPVGKNNVFLGPMAGKAATDEAQHNTVIGAAAGMCLATNKLNTFCGFRTGSYCKADRNTCVGAAAGAKLGSGEGNTFVGHVAGGHVTTGGRNVLIGDKAAGLLRTGAENVMVGAGAGSQTHAASRNVLVGKDAGAYNRDGAGNVYLGYQAGMRATGNNKLIIENGSSGGPLIAGDFAAGRVGIRTPEPACDLHVAHGKDPATGGFRIQNAAARDQYWQLHADAGSGDLLLFSKAQAGAGPAARIDARSGEYRTASDARFKRDVADLGAVLPRVLQLAPKTYRTAAEQPDERKHVGLIADDVEPLFPEAVQSDGEQGARYLSYGAIGVVAIQAIKEQQSQIDALREQNALLLRKVEQLESRWALQDGGSRRRE